MRKFWWTFTYLKEPTVKFLWNGKVLPLRLSHSMRGDRSFAITVMTLDIMFWLASGCIQRQLRWLKMARNLWWLNHLIRKLLLTSTVVIKVLLLQVPCNMLLLLPPSISATIIYTQERFTPQNIDPPKDVSSSSFLILFYKLKMEIGNLEFGYDISKVY